MNGQAYKVTSPESKMPRMDRAARLRDPIEDATNEQGCKVTSPGSKMLGLSLDDARRAEIGCRTPIETLPPPSGKRWLYIPLRTLGIFLGSIPHRCRAFVASRGDHTPRAERTRGRGLPLFPLLSAELRARSVDKTIDTARDHHDFRDHHDSSPCYRFLTRSMLILMKRMPKNRKHG